MGLILVFPLDGSCENILSLKPTWQIGILHSLNHVTFVVAVCLTSEGKQGNFEVVFLKFARISVLVIIGIISIQPIGRNMTLKMVDVYSASALGMLVYYSIIPIVYFMNEEAMLAISELNYFIASKDFQTFFFSSLLILVSFTTLNIYHTLQLTFFVEAH